MLLFVRIFYLQMMIMVMTMMMMDLLRHVHALPPRRRWRDALAHICEDNENRLSF